MASVLTAWTETVVRALDALGIDGRSLAADVGIPLSLLDDPEARVPLDLQTRLWHAAVEATGNDALGIDVSRHVRAGSFHGVGHAFVSSPTLRSALERAARFGRVTSDIVVATTHVEDGDFVYTTGWRHEQPRPAWESVDATMAAIVRTARHLLDRDVSPTRVALERPVPRNVRRFDEFFGCPVEFAAPAALLAFDREVVERPVPGGNERLASAGDQLVAAYLAELDDASSTADSVRALLVDALPGGEPSLAAIADELALSPRSLQRQLADEGTTFRQVLAETRRELADRLLSSGSTVTSTGLRLGFSETAAFSRAYRRWTGNAPSMVGRRGRHVASGRDVELDHKA